MEQLNIKVDAANHSLDTWDIWFGPLLAEMGGVCIAVGETKSEAIANAKAALLDALKQLEGK